MFFIATITLTPSRMARKLVANWFLRSKISRQTRVWIFMGALRGYFLGAGQQLEPAPEPQLVMAFCSEAIRASLVVGPSIFATSMPGGARKAVVAVLACGSAFS